MNIFDKYLGTITPSMENVQYQENSNLMTIVGNWIEKLRNTKYIDEKILNDKDFLLGVKKITGLNIVVKISDQTIAAVYAPYFDKNHIFRNSAGLLDTKIDNSSKQTKVVLDYFKLAKVSVVVDFKKGKVSGKLTEVPSILVINPSLLKKIEYISVMETSAMVIHELGHCVINFAYLGTVYRDNYLINEAILAMKGTTIDKKETIILDVAKELGIKDFKAESLLVDNNDQEQIPLQVAMLADTRQKWIDLTGYDFYNERTCEQLADHFAVQHRASRYLASATDKLERMGHGYRRGRGMHILIETAKAICMVTPFGLPFAALAICSSKGPERYDRPIQRLQTMQQVLRSNLKDASINPNSSKTKEILGDLKFIDELIDGAKDRMTFVDFMYHKLMPTGRKQLNNEQIQTAIGSLTSSKLYEQALRFKQLGVPR